MQGFIRVSAIVAAASIFAACASAPAPRAPASRAPVSKAAPEPTAMNATQAATALGMDGYRLEIRKGEEFYCRKEAVTGSRLEVHETCRTVAQMEQIRANTQDAMRQMQRPPEDAQLPANSPAAAGGF
jgi:hypothetical protein